MVTDGKGLLVRATLVDGPDFEITQLKPQIRKYQIHLFVAPTKNSDRMEWLVEKATEIGVSSITMVRCEHSERKTVNHDRLVKTAISAMKQSQQAWLPEIKALAAFDDIVKLRYDQNFIAFVDESNPDHLKDLASPGMSYGLLIGPEGDFTDRELALSYQNAWQKVSLGSTRLRTETAALAGVMALTLANT